MTNLNLALATVITFRLVRCVARWCSIRCGDVVMLRLLSYCILYRMFVVFLR